MASQQEKAILDRLPEDLGQRVLDGKKMHAVPFGHTVRISGTDVQIPPFLWFLYSYMMPIFAKIPGSDRSGVTDENKDVCDFVSSALADLPYDAACDVNAVKDAINALPSSNSATVSDVRAYMCALFDACAENSMCDLTWKHYDSASATDTAFLNCEGGFWRCAWGHVVENQVVTETYEGCTEPRDLRVVRCGLFTCDFDPID
jgi:hypothetical protein